MIRTYTLFKWICCRKKDNKRKKRERWQKRRTHINTTKIKIKNDCV